MVPPALGSTAFEGNMVCARRSGAAHHATFKAPGSCTCRSPMVPPCVMCCMPACCTEMSLPSFPDMRKSLGIGVFSIRCNCMLLLVHIPSAFVCHGMQFLITQGAPPTASLSFVSLQALLWLHVTHATHSLYYAEQKGRIVVEKMVDGSNAALGGLQIGDVIRGTTARSKVL